MKHTVERISGDLSKRLSEIESVEAITLADVVGDNLSDPYFMLSFDVYYRGAIPEVDSRRLLFADADAFESSVATSKDRFLLEGVPVRIEYKNVARIESILGGAEVHLGVFRQTGTYVFYRLQNATVLFKRSLWIEFIREELKALPDEFWGALAGLSLSTMEHALGDLSAAVLRADDYFYVVSAAKFVRSLCSLLFVLNRRFEPSGRAMNERILDLPNLPESFKARFETFLREDPDLPRQRRREVAELLARSLIGMTGTPLPAAK